MSTYFVWSSETKDGELTEVGCGPFSFEKARSFARIGSQYGGERIVTRNKSSAVVRKYKDGKRIFPVVNKQVSGFRENEIPEHYEDSGTEGNDMPSWFWVAAGVGAGVASLIAMLRGMTSGRNVQQGPVRIANNVATGPTGHTVTFDRRLKLVLAQTLLGEVAESAQRWEDPEVRQGGAAVLWSLIQLHMRWKSRTGNIPRMPTFEALIRNYVQPLNPQWSDPNAGKCLQHPDRCTPSDIRRRRRIQSYTWNTVPPAVHALVESWCQGFVPNPVPDAVDYAAYHFEGETVTLADNNFGTLSWRALV